MTLVAFKLEQIQDAKWNATVRDASGNAPKREMGTMLLENMQKRPLESRHFELEQVGFIDSI